MRSPLATRPTFRAVLWLLVAPAAGIGIFCPPFDTHWTARVLILAAVFVVPLGLRIVSLETTGVIADRFGRVARIAQFLAAFPLIYALLQPPGRLAAVLGAIYAAATLLVAAWGVMRAWRHRPGPVGSLCIDVGLVYLAVGGIAVVLDRAGLRPLDFDPAIIQLTAVHFHYAGFTLLLLAGLAAKPLDRLSQFNCVSVVVAVPLMAIGITASRLGASPAIECVAAWCMAIGGLLTAVQYVRLATEAGWPVVLRACWVTVAASLIFSMWAAVFYGSRAYLAIEWLDIPWMRALHGIANGFGVGLIGVLGWSMAARKLAVRRRTAIERVRHRSVLRS